MTNAEKKTAILAAMADACLACDDARRAGGARSMALRHAQLFVSDCARQLAPAPAPTAPCADCGGPDTADDWETQEGTALCCDCYDERMSNRPVPVDWL